MMHFGNGNKPNGTNSTVQHFNAAGSTPTISLCTRPSRGKNTDSVKL